MSLLPDCALVVTLEQLSEYAIVLASLASIEKLGVVSWVASGIDEVTLKLGATVSTVKLPSDNVAVLPTESLTFNSQSVYEPSLSSLSTISLSPATAVNAALEHDPA